MNIVTILKVTSNLRLTAKPYELESSASPQTNLKDICKVLVVSSSPENSSVVKSLDYTVVSSLYHA